MDRELDPELWRQLPVNCRNRILAGLPWLKLCVVTGRHAAVTRKTAEEAQLANEGRWTRWIRVPIQIAVRQDLTIGFSFESPEPAPCNPRVVLVPWPAISGASQALNFFCASRQLTTGRRKYKQVPKDPLSQGQSQKGIHVANWLDYSSPAHGGWRQVVTDGKISWQELPPVPVDQSQLQALQEKNLERFPYPPDFQRLFAPSHSPAKKRRIAAEVRLACRKYGH